MSVYENIRNLLEDRFGITIKQTLKGHKITTENFSTNGSVDRAVYYIEFTERYHKNKNWDESDGFHSEWQRLLTDIQCGNIKPYKQKIG